jgi:type II secretory ATPase GspE/PulE/Tfp pilus assembly ATPase PilB-like protein
MALPDISFETLRKTFTERAAEAGETDFLLEEIVDGMDEDSIALRVITTRDPPDFTNFTFQEDLSARYGFPVVEAIEGRTVSYSLFLRQKIEVYSGLGLDLRNSLGNPENPEGIVQGVTSNAQKYVESVLRFARDIRASDVHFEPREQEGYGAVKMRVDGVMILVDKVSLKGLDDVTSYLLTDGIGKNGNRVNDEDLIAAEHRLVLEDDSGVQYRLSTMQMAREPNGKARLDGNDHLYKIVVRLLETKKVDGALANLGLRESDQAKIRDLVKWDSGIVLVTGGTGKGKTTTVASTINEIAAMTHNGKNIVTLEDPVEYLMPNALQFRVSTDPKQQGVLTYGLAMEYILRQDPDVIFIGEARSAEVCKDMFATALSGHFVLSTFHASGVEEAITRMAQMGITGPTLNSALRGIVSQTLLRKVCYNCKEEGFLTGDEIRYLFQCPEDIDHEKPGELKIYTDFIEWARNIPVYRGREPGKGQTCEICDGTGHYDRLPIVEVYVHNRKEHGRILYDICNSQAEGTVALAELFQDGIHKPFALDAIVHMLRGDTTPSELMAAWPAAYFKDYGKLLMKETKSAFEE